MKAFFWRLTYWLGIVAMVVAAGFVLIACDDLGGNRGDDRKTDDAQTTGDGGIGDDVGTTDDAQTARDAGANNDAQSTQDGGTDGGCIPMWDPGIPSPSAAQQYCVDFFTTFCLRAFNDCTSQVNVPFSNESECIADGTRFCGTLDWSNKVYIQSDAEDCLNTMQTAPCNLVGDGADICDRIGHRPVLPDPTNCTAIDPGTRPGEITGIEPLYQGESAQTFCLCLNEGEVIETAMDPPPGGSFNAPFPGLFLVDPSGYVEGSGFAGGPHTVATAPFTVTLTGAYMIIASLSDVSGNTGQFQLLVTVQQQ